MFSDMTDDICPHCNRSIHESAKLAKLAEPTSVAEYGRSLYLTDITSWSPFETCKPLFTEDEIDAMVGVLHEAVFPEWTPDLLISEEEELKQLLEGKFKWIDPDEA